MKWIKRPLLRVYLVVEQFVDLRRSLAAVRSVPRYVRQLAAYRRLENGGRAARYRDLLPQLHDRTSHTSFDAHYIYVNAWAARQIIRANQSHVDVGSQLALATQLSASVDTIFVDFRPAAVRMSGLSCLAGDLTRLPFRDKSLTSLSCLHVAEHVGLGRYGDPLDPRGTVRATIELQRVLAPGGLLHFAVPVGKPRTNFNAHRVHDPREIITMFGELALRDFSFVDDDGRFHDTVSPSTCRDADYACGMFTFVRAGA